MFYFLIPVLVSAIVCGVFVGLCYISKLIAKTRIAKSSSAKKSVRVRQVFRIVRLLIIILFSCSIVLVLVLSKPFVAEYYTSRHSQSQTYEALMGVVFGITLFIYAFSYMSLPISGLTIDKFFEKESEKPFALFLRGFSSDDYYPELAKTADDLQERLNNRRTLFSKNDTPPKQPAMQFVPFSEKSFSYAMKKRMPLFSVGMTKELESPEGSKRVYLDDDSWQKDVSSLIERASYVFVLVNPSDSCLWEMQRCQDIAFHKTIYIIDKEDDLKEAQEKLQSKTPRCLTTQMQPRCMVYMRNNGVEVCEYKNNPTGFAAVLEKIFTDVYVRPYSQDEVFVEAEAVGDEGKDLVVNLNLRDSRAFSIANERIAHSTLSEEQKEALSMEVYLVHFGHKDSINWDAVPGYGAKDVSGSNDSSSC